MKEFNAQTGGRYTYVDDIINLQDLALAFGEIFDDCDNFIVSGCEVSGNSIGKGYVWLNGKLRYFSGATGITAWPQYIYESNKSETVAYASGTDKVGRTVYGCMARAAIPTTLDDITGQIPAAITISQTTGGTLMKDAFIGKYALLLNSAKGAQTINSPVNFAQDINLSGLLAANGKVQVKSGNSVSTLGYDYDGSFSITSTLTSGMQYKIAIEDGLGICFYVGGELRARVKSDEIEFTQGITTGTYPGSFGSVRANGTHIYNYSTATDDGVLYINVRGYDDSTGYFRNTYIGNGKGKTLLSITGSTEALLFNGTPTFSSSGIEGLVLQSTLTKANVGLQKAVVWKDSAGDTMGYVGYINTSNQYLSLVNNISDISISGLAAVNIGPAIKENGVLLSDKYVLRSEVEGSLGDKPDASSVYTKLEADGLFAFKAAGLGQFISGTVTQASLRSQIGALGADDLGDYVTKSAYLSDMATTEEAKQAICNYIGAASVGDFQTKLPDSGWKNITGGLYVRQIGNVVSIQGSVRTIHSGTLFTLPNTIAPPTFAVFKTIAFSNNVNYTVSIKANSRSCQVVYCNGGCNMDTYFSLTYMV